MLRTLAIHWNTQLSPSKILWQDPKEGTEGVKFGEIFDAVAKGAVDGREVKQINLLIWIIRSSKTAQCRAPW